MQVAVVDAVRSRMHSRKIDRKKGPIDWGCGDKCDSWWCWSARDWLIQQPQWCLGCGIEISITSTEQHSTTCSWLICDISHWIKSQFKNQELVHGLELAQTLVDIKCWGLPQCGFIQRQIVVKKCVLRTKFWQQAWTCSHWSTYLFSWIQMNILALIRMSKSYFVIVDMNAIGWFQNSWK